MDKILKYIEENRQRYLNELIEYVKIPSVSADPARAHEVRRAAEWCAQRLQRMGFEHVAVKDTIGQPVVYADWLHAGREKPTIMIYGHSDVQPEDPIEKWTHPPFEAAVRDGRIYGRGTNDNKGQCLTQLFALEAHLKQNGKLPVNMKVFIEGEEEAGGAGTTDFVRKNRELLSCNAVAISDSQWKEDGVPSIDYALRGICYLEVRVKGPKRDLHSGTYGGKIQNPLNAIGKIIAKLQNEDGVVQVPGFYDDVVALTEKERQEFRSFGNNDTQIMADLEVPALWGEKGFTTLERNWARPSCDVNGIWGGFSGKGPKTVIAGEGGFKLSARLVPNQRPEKCFALIKKYIESICPPGVRVEVEYVHGAFPMGVPIESPYLGAAMVAMEKGFGKRPKLVRAGETIPVAADFTAELGAPSIFVGYGLEGDHIHSPNESFRLDHYYKGIATNCFLYEEFSKISV